MVEGDGSVLHVSTGAHLFGGADENGDSAVAAGGEELGFVAVGFGVVDVADLVAREAPGGGVGAEVVGDVEGVGWGAEVAEDQLQGAGDGVRGFVGGAVDAVFGVVPDRGDPVGGGGGFAGGGLFEADEAQ